ncbi:MAG: hypothetical protein AMXMBFR59_41640 [Rhodanobacteraceae bacterium]|jgi:hypothetical protein|nr:DUF2127 domain-containing protein [Burkholderiaceae bacterium]MEB2349803.1 DUF2127 domain-containing protein [Burkholderiaceae bacterium]
MEGVSPPAKASRYGATRVALRSVALFEATKGFAALLLRSVDELNVTPLRATVLLGSACIGLRWAEVCALWFERAWGQWLGALGGAIYVPFELRHLWHEPAWQSAVVLIGNCALVGFLGWRLWLRRRASGAHFA